MHVKKFFTLLSVVMLVISQAKAQSLKSLMKSVSGDSSVRKITGSTGGLSTDDVVAGLKEALAKGTTNSTEQLSAADGFLKDAAIKILLPPEAKKAEAMLRSAGLGSLADNAINSMNHAAEDAAKSATPIFINAIKQMSIQDAWGILKGGDTSATHYLKDKTTNPLTTAFKPIIEQSMQKVNATKYWTDFATAYNKMNLFGKQSLDTDLSGYVTGKALDGIFYEIGRQEKNIRQNPSARTTALLQNVFAQQ